MKNRIIKSILVAILVIILSTTFSMVASANEGDKATLSHTPVQVVQGDTFTTTLYIDEQSNVCSMSVKLLYDKDAVTLVSCVQNQNSSVDTVINTSTEGEIVVTFANGSNLNSKLQLIDLTFKVNDYLASGEYTFLALDSEFDNTISRLDAQGSAKGIDFEYNKGKLNIYRAGDFNLDGVVNEADAVYLLRYEVGLKLDFEVTDFNLKIADAYANGEVGIDDAVSVLRYVAQLGDIIGNRAELVFYDQNGQKLKSFSIKVGEVFTHAPVLENTNGYKNGKWMVSNGQGELVEADFTKPITANQAYYAEFENDEMTDAMKYFVSKVATEHLAPNSYISSNQTLKTLYDIGYGNGYIARVIWESTNESILNSAGEYSQPAYETSFTMKAKITVYNNGLEESYYVLEIPYKTQGKFKTPAKSEIEAYLKEYIGEEISTDLRLPKKITNEDVESSDPYEIRLEWYINNNGVYLPISQIKRGTEEQIADLQAVLTFNGTPLEGDGKIYFDEITLTAVTEGEIRAYIIDEIAKNISKSVSNNYAFWSQDERYETTIAWKSGDTSIAVINNNVITIDSDAINGESLIVTADVTYGANKNFSLNYEVSVSTSNQLLVSGVNIHETLYNALIKEFDVKQLSIGTCKSTERVSLDLSAYPEIESLYGIQYCENLRYLNISGLKNIDDLTPISSLNNLEVLIASNCGLEQMTDTGSALLEKARNIVVIDLSGNKLKDLSSVLAPDTSYPTILELYLNDNQLNDVSLVSNAPFIQKLELANNELTSASIEKVSYCQYLNYLSLANNKIEDLSALSNLAGLKELRLQKNNISSVEPLKKLVGLKALYLGENNLQSADYLYNLKDLRILYLNDNQIADIGELSGLVNLNILNISNNKINSLANLDLIKVTEMPSELYEKNEIVDLTKLESCDSFTGLTELYADNNEIDIFRYVMKQTNLVKLTLADNYNVEESNIVSTLKPLVNLKTLTLSGKTLENLSFLESMTKLERLELANCSIPSYVLNQDPQEVDGKLQVTDYTDNIKFIANLGDTLKYLDISNNSFEVNNEYSFVGSTPYTLSSFDSLYRLVAFYANNVDIGENISIVRTMSAMKYISLENANIASDLSIFQNKRNYEYINLAENNITAVDLSNLSSAKANLKKLYLDTTSYNCTFANAFDSFSSNVLEELSLRNVNVTSVESLPDMESLKYLDIYGNTIADFNGRSEIYSIARFAGVQYVDVGKNEAVFLKENLNALYDAFNTAETVYLYDTHTKVGFDGDREALTLKSLAILTPYTSESKRIEMHTMYNQTRDLCLGVNNYDFSWYIEENDWFGITNNVLSVVGWDMREDNTLAITTNIDVYENDGEENAISFNLYVAPSPYKIIKYTQTASELNKDTYTEEVGYFNVPLDNDLINASRTDYTFDGWYTELYGQGTKIGKGLVNKTIDEDGNVTNVEVCAKWLYTVTFDPADGTCYETSRTYVSNQSLGELPDVQKDFHLLAGWKYDGSYVKETTVLPGHTTLTAVLVKEDDYEYPVHFIVPNGQEIASTGTKKNVTLALPTPVSSYPDYYTFAGWKDTSGNIYQDEFLLTTEVESVKLTAVWKQTYSGWYYVKNREDLENLDECGTCSIMLIDNIDLSGEEWIPLNSIACARFEGNNFTISNMTITGERNIACLFDTVYVAKEYYDFEKEYYVVADSCYIRNINLENVYINIFSTDQDSYISAAGFIGGVSFGDLDGYTLTIDNIDVSGEIIVRGYAPTVGGVFLGSDENINDCDFTGTIIVDNLDDSTPGAVGGILGVMIGNYDMISCGNCDFTGYIATNGVTTDNTNPGLTGGEGICGVYDAYVEFYNCTYTEVKPAEYTISFVNPEGGAIENMSVSYGSYVTLPTPTRTLYKDYYTFVHWVNEDGEVVDSSFAYTTKGNISLTAVWKQTYEDYTYIKDRAGLEAMSEGKYMLIDDIYLGNADWTPISTFSGEIQGNGFTIKNAMCQSVINEYGECYIGLIAEATTSCKIYNLKLENCGGGVSNISQNGTYFIGTLIAYVHYGCDLYIENVDGSGIGGGYDGGNIEGLGSVTIGSLIGCIEGVSRENDSNGGYKPHIVGCDVEVSVLVIDAKFARVGGIVGQAGGVVVKDCTVGGTIHALNITTLRNIGYITGQGLTCFYYNCTTSQSDIKDIENGN